MSKIDEIDAELKDLKEHPGNGTLVDCDSEREHQFWLKSRERISALVEYVRAAEHIIQLGRSAVTDGDFISDSERSMQSAREKLGLK